MRIRVLVLVLFVLFFGALIHTLKANHIGAVNITYIGADTASVDALGHLITVKATVDLLNVTVVNNNSVDIIWSKYTEDFQDGYFYRYDVYRSINPGFGYDSIGTTLDIDDTTFTDWDVTVVDTPYNYMIKMILDTNLLLTPVSDTIQSVVLRGTQNQTDTGIIDMLWTGYWGWDSAIYELYESIDLGPWDKVVTPSLDTTYAYSKSLLAGSYRLMIRSTEMELELVTESNWIEFVIQVRSVPNIITPNGDGINDFFFVNEQLQYEPIHLIVFNRWGTRVFEDTVYENRWDGDNFAGTPLAEGTYYYLLKLTGAKDRAGFITILR